MENKGDHKKAERKKKIIEIDDSGTGDLIGDAFIGLHDVETGNIIFRSVHVGLYNEKNLQENAPKKRILEIVKEGLVTLGYQSGDKIFLCTGDCFDLVRDYFQNQGIEYVSTKIEGKLQDAVEGRLVSHLKKLGVKSRRLSEKAGAQRYYVLWDWLCEDFYEREKCVKSGYKSWITKRRQMAIERYEKFLETHKKHISHNKEDS